MGAELLTLQSWGEEDVSKNIHFKSSSGRMSILASDFDYKENINIDVCPQAHVGIHLKQNQVKLLTNVFIEWLSGGFSNDLPNCDDRITEQQAGTIIYNRLHSDLS